MGKDLESELRHSLLLEYFATLNSARVEAQKRGDARFAAGLSEALRLLHEQEQEHMK